MSMNEQRKASLEAFTMADDAWHAELVAVYGKRAGDARYDPTRNAATPALKTLHDARSAAMRAYEYQQIRNRVAEAGVYA